LARNMGCVSDGMAIHQRRAEISSVFHHSEHGRRLRLLRETTMTSSVTGCSP
jgi:hypothetical protein